MKKLNQLLVVCYRLLTMAGLFWAGTAPVAAETVTNNLDVQGGFIYNHGAINPGDVGITFTNAGIRDVTISAGQLSGVDPETGAVITNAANLLPLKAQSLTTASNIVAGGSFIGNGTGLTNLNANALSGSISASSLPTSGVWNAVGVTITNANLAGDVTISSLTVSTNLTVQGTVEADSISAAGSSGEFQFNQNGQLTGTSKLFIHEETQEPAYYASGILFQVYKYASVAGTNLIYSLYNEDGTSVLRLYENGQDTIRLSGDGAAYIKGDLQLDGLLIADGSGLTNLPVQAQVDALIETVSNSPASSITTNDIAGWTDLAENIQVSTETVNIITNLTIQGTVQADSISAAGYSGEFQINQNGKLTGTSKLFMHEELGEPAYYAVSGNLFCVYKYGVVADTNLIYSLRNEDAEAVLCMFKDGAEMVKIKGDGSAVFSNNVVISSAVISSIPPQGDIPMFTE